MKTIRNRYFLDILIAITSLGTVFGVGVMLFTDVHGSRSPEIVSSYVVSNWEIGGGYAQGVGAVNKVRNCRRIPGSESGYVYINGNRIGSDVVFSYPHDNSPKSTLATGETEFGLVRWDFNKGLKPKRVGVVMQHQCGSIVEVSIFVFDLPALGESRH